jgi:c-di-GMP-binding flagellar brake protein YcgR
MPNQPDDKFLASLKEDGLEEFLLRGSRQIRQLLHELIKSRTLVSVHLLPAGLTFLSTVIALSDDEQWVFLDASQDKTIHRRSLQAERLLCVTQLNKIRIQFRLNRVLERLVGGHPALAAPIPGEVLRLQRRDSFRLQVPLSHELRCVFPSQENDPLPPHHHARHWKKAAEVPVVDISAGGLSLELSFGKTSHAVGDQIIGCRLKLPDNSIIVDLEVRNNSLHLLNNGKQVLRLGCSFISLPTQAANQIQRFIYQIEREIRAFLV